MAKCRLEPAILGMQLLWLYLRVQSLSLHWVGIPKATAQIIFSGGHCKAYRELHSTLPKKLNSGILLHLMKYLFVLLFDINLVYCLFTTSRTNESNPKLRHKQKKMAALVGGLS